MTGEVLFSATIPGPPVGKQAKVVTRSGRTFFPKRTAAYTDRVAALAHVARGARELHVGPAQVTIEIRLAIPQSARKRDVPLMRSGEIKPTKKPDCSNVAKLLEDALNKVLWHDDSQVTDLVVRKRWAEADSVTVEVRAL